MRRVTSFGSRVASWKAKFAARLIPGGSDQRGVIIIGAYIITLLFIAMSLSVAEFGVSHYTSARRTVSDYNALNAAEAGGDAFMDQIALSSTYQGTTNAPTTATDSCTGYISSPVTLINNNVQGKVTYESCVKNGTLANEKIVTATGKIYLPANSSTPRVTRKIRLTIAATTTAGYAVQTGPGGLTMGNIATITNGQVYVNGKLNITNIASIGTAVSPVQLWVANAACPSPATAAYPATCNANQTGILGSGTQNDAICVGTLAHIYGSVNVVNQGTNCSTAPITSPGIVGSTAPLSTLPTDNRASLTAANFPTSRTDDGNCPFLNFATTWQAGTHFKGDVNVNGLCAVVVKGDIWIDGSFNMSGATATLVPDPSLTTPPTIAIDGSSGFTGSAIAKMLTNLNGVGFRVITYYAQGSACSPNCSNLTGAALATAAAHPTISLSSVFLGLGSDFYARWGEADISSIASVGSLIGQGVNLNTAATITLGASSFTTTGAWSVKYYEQIYQ